MRDDWELSERRLQRQTRWVFRIAFSLIGVSAVISLLFAAVLIFGLYKAVILIEEQLRSQPPAPTQVQPAD